METVERTHDAGGSRGRSEMGRGDGNLADADLIRAIGSTLFGYPVADAMARGLEMNRRTVQRWLNAQNAVPDNVWETLAEMVDERLQEAHRLQQRLAARRADNQR
jgi:hypothetical protein